MNKGYIAIIISVIISLALIISTFTLSSAIKSINKDTTIGVTGSAQEDIKSDYATWNGTFSTTAVVAKGGYAKLVSDKVLVSDYLKSLDVKDAEISFSSINSYPIYKRDYNNNPSNEIEGYTLSQTVTVKSINVDLVDKVSRNATDLINQDVNFSSEPAAFYCKDLSKRKIEMIGKATKDCKDRAENIVKNSGGKLGSIISAKTGVFQITPQNSTEISDYGVNDTTSIDKQITAVVKCTFSVN
ncbi:MAG: hypothetical protein A2Y24_07225 [Clostridiales bacterium GWE2_32_10]|nr:MAG: hypothetical protein A2Y24_07225 [Clostridiales bacterium GWE2_32_10]